MKALGIDYGKRNIGLAISDESRTIAFGLRALRVRNSEDALEQIVKFINENDISDIIIGMPLGLEGKPTQISKEIEDFIENLEEKVNINIVKWDESMTSRMAIETAHEAGLKKRDKDIEAARIILQEYLEHTT